MSLPNPNTVVTEERLAQFYAQILPYLGGMPDILSNKFAKSDLYSTDEKMIGRWIDGKPIYQKTWTGLNVDMAYNQWTSIVAAPEGANLIIKNILLGKDSSNNPVDISSSGYELFIEDGYIKGEWNQNVNQRNIIAITVQYTKTTDSSVEIGDETDYSTSEKIVGTWMGKPIYQITIDCGAMPNNTSKHITWASVGISDLECVVCGWGQMIDPSTGASRNIPFPGPNASSIVHVYYEPTELLIQTGYDWSTFNCYMTIQYTKTTD